MRCIFGNYKTVYYNPHKEYVSFKINLKKLTRERINLRLNALMKNKICSCEMCASYTGNRIGGFDNE